MENFELPFDLLDYSGRTFWGKTFWLQNPIDTIKKMIEETRKKNE
jgi:hypothetical protein